MVKVSKDHDYAWIIVGAGAGLMLVGPSTYSTSGLLFENVEMDISYRIWIINTMYNIWNLSGALAGPLSTVFTYRKVAMLGCFSGALGFLMAASTLSHRSWLFLAFTGFVGAGMGLAVHSTFLLVMSNFEKYQGMANGVLHLGGGIGYFIAPYIYNVLPAQEDKFHVKALVTVLAFLAAILFIPLEGLQNIGHKKTRRPNSEVNTAEIPETPSRSCREAIPLMEIENKAWVQTCEKPKKRGHCHYLQAVSASILPNIPEESEGTSSVTGASTPVSGASANNLAHLKLAAELKKIELESEGIVEGECNESSRKPIEIPKRKSSSSIDEIGEANVLDGNEEDETETDASPKHFKKKSENYVTNNNQMQKCKRDGNGELFGSSRPNRGKPRDPPVPFRHKLTKALKSVDVKYFLNLEFLIMALVVSLALVSSPTVPIVLYGYVTSLHGVDYKGEGETALLILFSLDVISRLFISYISDFLWLDRKVAFFAGSVCASVVVAGLGFTSNTHVIYLLCASYGICHGTLLVTEGLIFCDTFGLSALSTTYGLLNCVKVIVNIIVTLLVRSPTIGYMYAIHPITVSSNEKYRTLNETSNIFDPLGLFGIEEETKRNNSFMLLFILLSIPGIFGAIIWAIENLWLRVSKTSVTFTSQRFSNESNDSHSHQTVINNFVPIEV